MLDFKTTIISDKQTMSQMMWAVACSRATPICFRKMTAENLTEFPREYCDKLHRYMFLQLMMQVSLSEFKPFTVGELDEDKISCEHNHVVYENELNRVFSRRGFYWSQLPCVMYAIGLDEIPDFVENPTLDHVIDTIETTLDKFPLCMSDVSYEDATVEHDFDIAHQRAILYGTLVLTYGLPEKLSENKVIFPTERMEDILDDDFPRLMWKLICKSQKEVKEAYQKGYDSAERIYRFKQGTPENLWASDMIVRYPSALGTNLKSLEDILSYKPSFSINNRRSLTHWEQLESACSILIIRAFGKNWSTWVNRFHIIDDYQIVIHDASQMLREDLNSYQLKSLGKYLLKYVNHRYIHNKIIAAHWVKAPENYLDIPPAELSKQIVGEVFPNNGSELEKAFAYECVIWNLEHEEYERVQTLFLESQKIPLPKFCDLVVKNGNYTGRFLRRSDPRGLYLGEYTNCCQSVHSVAHTSAVHGQCSPNGCFFIIESKDGDIISESWVWTDQSVVFDSIEAKGIGKRVDTVKKIYSEMASRIKSTTGLNVKIGVAHQKVFEKDELQPSIVLDNYPDGSYSDAKKNQFFLA